MRIDRISPMSALAAVFCLLALPAHASWQMYATGKLGYSIAESKVAGSADPLGFPEPFSGRDQHVSPLLGGALGVEIPLPELTPWRLPYDLRLPDWPVRFELEAVGLREYKLTTHGLFASAPNSDPFHTDIKAWSLMQNVWIDIPLRGLYHPVSKASGFLFRRPRLPWLRRLLKPATVYAGLGIGLGHLRVKTDESNFAGKTNQYDFAYQFGMGFGYQLTDSVNLGVGYRYYKPAKLKVKLSDDASRPGRARVLSNVHEIQFAIRVRFFDLPYPWR